MTTSVDVSVDPVQFRYLRGQLWAFDRVLLGKLNSRLRRAIEPAKAQAEGASAGLAGLRAGTHASTVNPESTLAKWYKGGPQSLKVKVGGGTSSGGLDAIVRLVSTNKAVSIAEFAAKSSTPQGAGLLRVLSRWGAPGRHLWQAVDDNETEIVAAIRMEVRKTEDEFTVRLASGMSAGVL